MTSIPVQKESESTAEERARIGHDAADPGREFLCGPDELVMIWRLRGLGGRVRYSGDCLKGIHGCAELGGVAVGDIFVDKYL